MSGHVEEPVCNAVRPGTLGYQRCGRPIGHRDDHRGQDRNTWPQKTALGIPNAKSVADGEECRRCGGPNVVWCAPSPLWNMVMRGNDINGPIQYADLVCMACFVALADDLGLTGQWRLSLSPEPEGLVNVTPSGRTWNPETWLWEDDPALARAYRDYKAIEQADWEVDGGAGE